MILISLEQFYTVVAYVMAGLFGLCIGSFLNVVIYRVPLGMSVATPPSHCPNCDYKLKWYDNVPVISYLCLGGKCRNCKEKISFRYTAVELGNMLLWLLSVYCFRQNGIPAMLLAAATSSILLCVFFIDLEHLLIFDRFQILLAVLGIGATLLDRTHWLDHAIGAAAGFAVFMLMAAIGEKIAGREALGGGDIKLCAVMGLYLGWQKLLLALLVASLVGSAVLLILKSVRKESGKEYPFAPFLTAGFALSIFAGDAIVHWYLSLLI